jgi:HK97 family phage portal protein
MLSRGRVVPGREEKAAVPLAVLAGQAGPGWEGRSYAALARNGFCRNPVAYRSVRLVAEAAASVPVIVAEDGRETADSAVTALLRRPNPLMAGPEFLEALIGHLLLSGNAFVEPVAVGGAIREIYLIRPDRVTVEAGVDGWPRALKIATGSGERRLPFRGLAGDPLHIRLFHPLDEQAGFAPLAAAGQALDLSNAAATWNKALLDNSARPSGALVYQPKDGGNLTPAQYDRLKRELEEGYSGTVSAGRPLLLEGGLDWKAMGLTPRDMDFAEARNGAARDIALALGVPPMLLGIPGDNTYANYQEANRAFWRLTVIPLLTRTLASLAHWLEPPGPRLTLTPDLDQIPGLSAERGELWARVGAADFLTQAEKREAVGYGGSSE